MTAIDTARNPLRTAGSLGLGVVMLWLSLVVFLPLAAVVATGFDRGVSGFLGALGVPATLAALGLSAGLALVVSVVNAVIGTGVAWVLVRDDFAGRGILDRIVDVPFALPTIVTGVVMLALYGAGSPIGVNLVGTRAGLLVSLLFVTLPFTVRTVQPVLRSLQVDIEEAATTLGASRVATFRRIVLPSILPAILSGSALSFARAIGEYGSLVLISSNLPFTTQIASALIYGKLQDSLDPVRSTQEAAAIATVLLVVCAIVLVAVEALRRRAARRG